MSTAYERVKRVIDDLERDFYALLDTCDGYARLLDDLVTEEQARDAPDPELLRRYAHQRREIDELREQLESEPMGTYLRISDRILMIKVAEEGRFL